MQVRVGSTLSDLYYQDQGVPQESIFSTALFSIKINNIVNCLDNKIDGFCMLMTSKYATVRKYENNRENSLTKYRIEDWVTNNGFKLSNPKTQ